ncbi:aminopeptidase N [Sulfurimonas sp. HSL1-2]|uniref:aminopeptidase N n=1 Tax=Thiomicrolovo zhangzhouensis TaxID=3131933 RepID=UPI0031F740FB
MSQPKTIYLKEYEAPAYQILTAELTFEIFEEHTLVINRMTVKRRGDVPVPLLLDGDDLKLLCVKVDDVKIPDEAYSRDAEALTIFDPGAEATVQVVTKIYPDQNTALEGLYRSGGIYCTQCEPHGFRRITYFIDRPDNMSVFTVKVIAEQASCPVLLSNGNLEEEGSFPDGRHYALWHDPFPKPSYLFALVAGDLGHISDSFTTAEGNTVALNIYVDKGNESRADHAMRSLKASMRWDEETYGRSYDLSVYNIVAVDSFNMGAMENKGLNVFNSHYVLADEETATDADFLGIESVIAHEYFHNWTGNRITCRDWFQLTLKEGLTVFRDQSFSADMQSEVVQRIRDVDMLRERQFPEDAGPTAHPIKPEQYIEINNFYTATVYEKGSEVIRMLNTILGEKAWRAAMDLYFETFDGQAVRTEDFLWAMQQYSPIDLTQFALWYSQERTPSLCAEHSYDAATGRLTLKLEQIVPDAVDGRKQQPYCMPLRLALLGHGGEELPLQLEGDTAAQPLLERGILLVTREEESFTFGGLASEPTLSLNRHFGAPVVMEYPQADVMSLMRYDSDGFVRYEAAQSFARSTLEAMMRGEAVSPQFLQSFSHILEDESLDLQFKAQLLSLPTVTMLMQAQQSVDVHAILEASDALKREIAVACEATMRRLYEGLHRAEHVGLEAESIGARALKNRLLGYLMAQQDAESIAAALAQYEESRTMTDRLAALQMLHHGAPAAAEAPMRDFYARYSTDMLVMTKYFSVIASSPQPDTLSNVRAAMEDAVFNIKVPNLVRALIGSFARNPYHFHAYDGSGYAFVAEQIIALDAINPMIAAGLAGAYKTYNRLNPHSRAQMRDALEKVQAHRGISKNVYEIVGKILAG